MGSFYTFGSSRLAVFVSRTEDFFREIDNSHVEKVVQFGDKNRQQEGPCTGIIKI